MKSLKSKEIIKILEERGFMFVRQKGSHRIFRKGDLRVTVPYHNKDLKPGTLRNILKEAGIEKEEI